MRNIRNLLFATILISTHANAQSSASSDKGSSRVPEDLTQKYPEIYLENDSILIHRDSSSGIMTDPHYTGKETNRLSASYQGSLDYTDFTEIASFDLQYQFKSENYTDTWWAFQFKTTNARYNAIADEIKSETGHVDSDANSLRAAKNQSINTFGIGAGYRFKFLFSFNTSERFYEHITAFLTYNTVIDSSTQRAYNGWGYNADYSLLYRSGNSLYYGLKFSYNLAAVVRGAISDEKTQDRSLVYGWSNVGLEIGYYY